MRNVKRLPMPHSLKKNAEQWTKELLDEIEKKGSYKDAEERFKSKYRQEDVKDVLEKMYNMHCCYCESLIGISSFGRIEHLRPKSLPEFYHLAFEWDNLHWCCEMCNNSKGAKWDFANPILDPAKEDVEQFLKLNLDTGEYEAVGNDKRAETTITHTDMNREKLVKARKKVIIRFLEEYKVYQEQGKGKAFCEKWERLKDDMDYPSLYDALIQKVTAIQYIHIQPQRG